MVAATSCCRVPARNSTHRRRPTSTWRRQRVSGPGRGWLLSVPAESKYERERDVQPATTRSWSSTGGEEMRCGSIRRRGPKISPKPIRFIINTQAAPNNIGGNEALARSGKAVRRTCGRGGISAAGSGLGRNDHCARERPQSTQRPQSPTPGATSGVALGNILHRQSGIVQR